MNENGDHRKIVGFARLAHFAKECCNHADVDIPSRTDIERLIGVRAQACMSFYLPTTPLTQDVQADRIVTKNLAACHSALPVLIALWRRLRC